MSDILGDQHTTGRIVAVHEQSMHVVTEQGVDYELLIPPDCAVELAELERYRDSGINVRVDFEGSPSAHSAHLVAVRPAGT